MKQWNQALASRRKQADPASPLGSLEGSRRYLIVVTPVYADGPGLPASTWAYLKQAGESRPAGRGGRGVCVSKDPGSLWSRLPPTVSDKNSDQFYSPPVTSSQQVTLFRSSTFQRAHRPHQKSGEERSRPGVGPAPRGRAERVHQELHHLLQDQRGERDRYCHSGGC